MSYITDAKHLYRVIRDGYAALSDLEEAWLEEDRLACAPSSGSSIAVTSNAPSNPTERIATGRNRDDAEVAPSVDAVKYRDRDKLGSSLLFHVERMQKLVEARKPRHTGGMCRCCDTHTATHGGKSHGSPTDCYSCFAFLKRKGYRCDESVHKYRPPEPQFCECPKSCCDECHDRVPDHRTSVSDRCAKRKSRGAWVAQVA